MCSLSQNPHPRPERTRFSEWASRCVAVTALQKEHPDEHLQVSVLGKLAGEKWKMMSDEHKAPYEELSKASKAEYAKQKMLTPEERRAYAAGLLVSPSMGMPQVRHGDAEGWCAGCVGDTGTPRARV
jgi:hypothetical protein